MEIDGNKNESIDFNNWNQIAPTFMWWAVIQLAVGKGLRAKS